MDGQHALDGDITQDEPQPAGEVAVNGDRLPAAALSAGMFLDILEEGRFSQDAYAEIRDLGLKLKDHALTTRKTAKGRITITIDVECEGDAYRLQPKIAIKEPELPRPKSVAWTDQQGRFTRFPPNQGQFFGVREAGGAAPVRSL